jgi:hypothetical protein
VTFSLSLFPQLALLLNTSFAKKKKHIIFRFTKTSIFLSTPYALCRDKNTRGIVPFLMSYSCHVTVPLQYLLLGDYCNFLSHSFALPFKLLLFFCHPHHFQHKRDYRYVTFFCQYLNINSQVLQVLLPYGAQHTFLSISFINLHRISSSFSHPFYIPRSS